MTPEPEPWDIAAAREHGLRDWLAMAIMAMGALAWALVPSARLVAFTALRLGAAALLATATLVTSGLVAQAFDFGSRAFLLLALFSLAGHVEAATFGPLVDRIAGRDRP